MANLIRNNWSKLWTPNSDEVNGDPAGLLRADNLTLEEDGVLSLIRGTKKATAAPFAGTVTQLYSKTMDLQAISGSTEYPINAKVRYAVHEGSVIRNYSSSLKREDVFDQGIISGVTPTNVAGFGFGFGHVFITYGNQKVKDDGIKRTEIGLPRAQPPFPTANTGPFLFCSPVSGDPSQEAYGPWDNVENGNVFVAATDHLEIDMDDVSFRAIAMRGLTVAFSVDLTAFEGVSGSDTETDIFTMKARIADTNKFVNLIVTFLLRDPIAPTNTPDATDYYQFEWKEGFVPGINSWSSIECLRREFKREGTNSALTWKDVKGIKVTFVSSSYTDQSFVIASMKFEGGTSGPLDGQYRYVQVDVQNNGLFLEKSIGSDESIVVKVRKTTIKVNPTTVNPNANECWIYRRGVGLSEYYLVKKITGAYGFDPAEFDDDMTDSDALRLNERFDYFQTSLPDDIIGMECNWKGRNWYITVDALYPSYINNPSAYDARYKIETANKNIESNLFITRLTNDLIVLATTGDFYEISGTTGILNVDGIDLFDINIRPFGIKSPPISPDFVVREGNLFYLASDGVRVLSGSSCQLLIPEIDLLFKGFNRYGIAPLRLLGQLRERYYLKIRKNRLYFSTVQEDNKRALYVFSFEDKNWRYEQHGDSDSIMAMWVEDDDTLIYSTASFGDKFLRILDIGTKFDELNKIPFTFLTIRDHNGQPANRKDCYTLKLFADTGGTSVNIKLKALMKLGVAAESNIERIFNVNATFTGKQELQFPIYTTIGLAKTFQLEITGTVDSFKLFNFSIDYDPRPEQLSVLRVPPSNFAIAGRKRIFEIPFIIDTLGNSVDFTPILDGVAQSPLAVQTTDKTLRSYMFIDERAAFDIGAMVNCANGVFEFYELVQPREIELLPDPIKYRWIPYTNLGSGSRKRFIQYAIVVDTRGRDAIMVPYIDGVEQTNKIINTNRKQTVIYVFDHFAIGVDVACVVRSLDPFEFYEINLSECVTEKLPPLARYLTIPYTNFNTSSRKRIRQFAFVIDSYGSPITFKPKIDGIDYPPQTFQTDKKDTVIYTFDSFAIGIDIGGTIEGAIPFEFYGPNLEDCIYEKLPPLASHLHIAYDNFGTTSRKRMAQYAFVIDTFGASVTFTPYIDGIIADQPLIFKTNHKETVIYTYSNFAVGVDIGGTLSAAQDFEFYGLALDNASYEKLPAKVKSMEIGCTNYGIAARKRIRTIPMVLNTFGHNVTYTPKVDGVPYPVSIFNTNDKLTQLHYFENNGNGTPFGIDYCGTLKGDFDFEFYELLKPENVETLPVGKKFDQFGPIEFPKVGKIREISIRMVHTGSYFDFMIFSSDSPILKGSVSTVANIEKTYVISCPKGINPNIFRMELSAPQVFHRFDASVKVNIDGAQTENKWIKVK